MTHVRGEKNDVIILQVDNLNITHENFKLELENSHSEKVEELKKEYESSFSGKYFVFKYICYSTATYTSILINMSDSLFLAVSYLYKH